MTQLITQNSDPADEEWAAKIRALTTEEQAEMLTGAAMLLRYPDALGTPLESDLYVLREQARKALGVQDS